MTKKDDPYQTLKHVGLSIIFTQKSSILCTFREYHIFADAFEIR